MKTFISISIFVLVSILVLSLPVFAKESPPVFSGQSIMNYGGFLMGLITFVLGGVSWYRGAIEKSFASEREFKHLKGNQEQMSRGLGSLSEEIEELSHDLKATIELSKETSRRLDLMVIQATEVKGIIHAIFQRQEGIAARIDGGNSTGGWTKTRLE